MALTQGSDSRIDMMGDLRRGLFGLLPLPTALVAFYALMLMEHIYGRQPAAQMAAGLWLLAAAALTQWLKARRPFAAAVAYLAGLLGAVWALIWITNAPQAVALYPAIIVLTVGILGPGPMVGVTGLGVGVIVAAARSHDQFDLTLTVTRPVK